MPFEGHISVLVVDDHPGIRAGVAGLINAERPRMSCVATAGTAEDALDRTREMQPHVVVLDVNLNGEDGLALIPALHHAAPCAVVVLTSLADAHVAAQAVRHGARACLHKSAPATELVAAIAAAWRADETAPESHGTVQGRPVVQAFAAGGG